MTYKRTFRFVTILSILTIICSSVTFAGTNEAGEVADYFLSHADLVQEPECPDNISIRNWPEENKQLVIMADERCAVVPGMPFMNYKVKVDFVMKNLMHGTSEMPWKIFAQERNDQGNLVTAFGRSYLVKYENEIYKVIFSIQEIGQLGIHIHVIVKQMTGYESS